ncbi:ADP-ribosylglycohydrolase family protein [Candidatus Poribacteria bacterium]
MARDILDAVYGCLMGGAIGDALGASTEGMYYKDIRSKYGRITGFMSYDKIAYSSGLPGAVTDDTTLNYYMCLAIVRKGGRITPDDAAKIWMEELNPDRFWSPDKIAYMKLKAGVSPWDAGRDNIPSACATMAMAPIGIINAGNPTQAYQDGHDIAGINGDGFNRDAPATLAAGVAAALMPGIKVDEVVEIMTNHSSYLVKRAIELTIDLASASDSVDDFTERFYDKMLDWWSRPGLGWRKDHFNQGTSIETVPVAMAMLYLCQGDVNQCVIEAANFGRDADSIASLTGAIAGAMQGASAIRQDWIETSEKANRAFFEEVAEDTKTSFSSMACRLVEALKSERQAVRERAEFLDRILR